jgi:GTP-binding protein
MFADKVEIDVQAGRGGDGRTSFRHEKYRPRGGPDGGNGGKGGDVVFRTDHNANTLARFRTNRSIKAASGMGGGTNRKNGAGGKDQVVKVPVGTLVIENGEVIADLATDGQEFVVAKGGAGGFGNAHFISSVRQTPHAAELGEPGESKHLTLELKLVADIGLIGLPNAGKSTLLSVISNAKPEIADYPFTTLVPNLGVTEIDDLSVLVADIPGLIAGASQGKGLGDEFLRHIERTSVLIHLIDCNDENIAASYRTIQEELGDYQVDLRAKPQLVALSKIETKSAVEVQLMTRQLKKLSGCEVFAISAVAHQGLNELLRAAARYVRASRAAAQVASPEVPVIDLASQPELWELVQTDSGFMLSGQKIERFVTRTDFDNTDSLQRLWDILTKMGIRRELERQGAAPGTIITVAGKELEVP